MTNINRIVTAPEGHQLFWDGSDFVMEYRNKLLALNKTDEQYPLMVEQLLKQNNADSLESLKQQAV